LARPVLIILLDTNVLRDNAAMTGPLFTALKAFARLEGCEVVVPEVVLEELTAHLATEIEKIQRSITKFKRRSAFAGSVAWKDHEDLSATEVRESLRSRLGDAGFSLAPFPEVAHEEIVARMHAGRKPFGRGESEVGYRDYLIWRVAVAVAENDEVVLITENSRDFAGPEGTVHEDLAVELGSRTVTVSSSLHEVVQCH
jgi:rRNA-processing protein FCF1